MSLNIPASVHRRLLNYAHDQRRPFNEVLQYYCLQRFLYRLGQSPLKERFILKGALMLVAWRSPVSRPTRDIDLLGRLDNAPETIVAAIRDICGVPVPEDGLFFDAASVMAERITEEANYSGVRVRFSASLGNARIPMQIDVGFGDLVVPGPTEIGLPAILGFPPAELWGYSRESAIAEKVQAMVALGEINSRLKDFYDIWLLSNLYAFDGNILYRAIQATFAQRHMRVTVPMVALEPFFADAPRETQWRAFLQRNSLTAPATLQETTHALAGFLYPVLGSLVEGHLFSDHWPPGGPWRTPL
ncbi:MAG: nucleotidyl transferase AbiEii/AbiGii toxin family protein [Anaerolineae bacterium]